MKRRWISALVVSALLAGCSKPPVSAPVNPKPAPRPPVSSVEASPVRYDLVIKGGTLIDGTGKAAYRGDVAISEAKIAAVGDLGRYSAAREINATGLIVAPGFINPHSHTHDDAINPFPNEQDSVASLMQGITTEIGGVDGRSPVEIGVAFQQLQKEGTGVNFGLFIGQGSVRGQVMGQASGPANLKQLAEMQRLVRKAMDDGAFGLSTGLEYLPGLYAGTDEIAALAAETKAHGGIYSTHLRSEGDRIVESLEEALAVGRKAGVPVNLSHLKIVHSRNWGKENQVVGLIEGALKSGQRVFADVYPYLAPDYGVNRLLSEWAPILPPEYLLIVGGADPKLHGKTVAEAAPLLGVSVSQAAETLLVQSPKARIVALVTSEAAMIRFYQAPWSVASTDGESQPKLDSPERALGLGQHRRSYGSYPMLLGYYVRERKILALEQAIRKATGQVADYLGIKSRGYLKPGQYADLVLFDAGKIEDRTTWLLPQEYPTGIRYVLVNGQIAVEAGKWIPGRRGQIVKPGE